MHDYTHLSLILPVIHVFFALSIPGSGSSTIVAKMSIEMSPQVAMVQGESD